MGRDPKPTDTNHTHKNHNRDSVAMENPWATTTTTTAMEPTTTPTPAPRRLSIDRPALEAAWDLSTGSGGSGEWADWLRRVSVELVRQSPSPVLRPCAGLAQVCVQAWVFHVCVKSMGGCAWV